MSKWDHEGHDRRRGIYTQFGFRMGWTYICLTCHEDGFTVEDIESWPSFTRDDYKRHMVWLDPEVYEWSNDVG